MDIATNTLRAIDELDALMAPLMAQKRLELAKLHKAINSALECWSEQFTEVEPPDFDGVAGFGFSDRPKSALYPDELLIDATVDGDNLIAKFMVGVLYSDPADDFTITVPLRYLDDATGVIAVIVDATFAISQRLNEVAISGT
jgi:hypothetical protein